MNSIGHAHCMFNVIPRTFCVTTVGTKRVAGSKTILVYHITRYVVTVEMRNFLVQFSKNK